MTPHTVGILSRPGPSLIYPGAIATGKALRGPSTNTFLDGFVEDPSTGGIYVPHLSGGTNSPSLRMKVLPLSRETLPGFRRTVDSLFEDAGRIARETQRWGLLEYYPLVATGGDWFLGEALLEYVGDVGDPWVDVDSVEHHASLRGPGCRAIEVIAFQGGREHLLTAGWRGESTVALQLVSIGTEAKRPKTEGYHFEFFGTDSLQGLKEYLGIPEATGPELAFRIAAAIYSSHQYPQGKMRGTARFGVGNGKVTRLPADESFWGEVLRGQRRGKRVFKIDMGAGDTPVASVHWMAEEEGQLVVQIRSGDSGPPLMPLEKSLRDLLWNGALKSLYTCPY